MNNPVVTTATASANRLSETTLTRRAGTAGASMGTIWMILKITFSVVPIVAGLDKFTNLLTNWENYLNPVVAQALPFSPHIFMGIVGIIEIAAGVVVFYRPRLGALIVTAWLVSISLSLLASGHYLDVAVRDLVMAISAFTLASLTPVVESSKERTASASH